MREFSKIRCTGTGRCELVASRIYYCGTSNADTDQRKSYTDKNFLKIDIITVIGELKVKLKKELVIISDLSSTEYLFSQWINQTTQ